MLFRGTGGESKGAGLDMDSDWNQFQERRNGVAIKYFLPIEGFLRFFFGLALEDGPLICFARPRPMADMKKLNGSFILTLHDSLVFIVFANGAPYDDFHRCLWSKSWTWSYARSSRCLFPISSNSNPHFRSSSVRSPPKFWTCGLVIVACVF